jgi:hypothetical protein
MTSRQFTVDPVKKQVFINIFFLMPETRVDDAMRKAEFTKKDIADLLLWHFLQCALPGRSIKGLKAYIARQRKPPPHLPVDPAAAHRQQPLLQPYLAASTKAATAAAATVPPAAAATVPPEEVVIHHSIVVVVAGHCNQMQKRLQEM